MSKDTLRVRTEIGDGDQEDEEAKSEMLWEGLSKDQCGP